MTEPPNDDYDSPWKEALERYFPEFLGLLFPCVQAGIDWYRGYEFLDKELQQVVRDAELGRRYADKLVKVHTSDGAETWVLVHVEVQGAAEAGFAQRMYVYNTREQVLELFRVLDWMLRLPDDLEREFKRELIAFEEQTKMPYVTSIERLSKQEGREEGREEGRQQGQARVLLRLITLKFGLPSEAVREQIATADPETLLRWSERILTALTLVGVLG